MTPRQDDDRLSALSDDLLRSILHFVPFKEAARTSALSRRWGSLWRSSGGVNLVVRVHGDGDPYYGSEGDPVEAFFRRRDDFVRAAEAALAAAATAAAAPVTRLTVHVEAARDSALQYFLYQNKDWMTRRNVVGDLVSHPAARRVEELRLDAVDPSRDTPCLWEDEMQRSVGIIYGLGPLPCSGTLRVLDLTSCKDLSKLLSDSGAAAFPRLVELRLRHCTVKPSDLQALFDAAPELATVNLEYVFFEAPQQFVRLRCPAATALVLVSCGWQIQQYGGIEIDAPRLRSFVYRGLTRRFLLRSPAPDMAWVDLHLHPAARSHYQDEARALFWQFLHNFANARSLKLKVNDLNEIAAFGKTNRAKLLCAFPNVERLELGGAHGPAGKAKAAAVAIANLLHCCPALRDLRLNLSTVPSTLTSLKNGRYASDFMGRKDRQDYEKSLDRFTRLWSKRTMISMDDHRGGGRSEEIPEIRGLSGRSYKCLQSSLRRVGLQFRLDKPNCLGVRLLKFFADHAMALEQICVDTGNQRLSDHMNLDIARWIAPNSSKALFKCNNRTECSWEFSRVPIGGSLDSETDLEGSTTGFAVLPLQR